MEVTSNVQTCSVASNRRGQTDPSLVGSRSSVSQITAAEITVPSEQKHTEYQLASPFVRQDIFYTGSITTLQEYQTSPGMIAYMQVISLFSARQRIYF